MADALVSPAVGGTLWVASGSLIALCARRVKTAIRDSLVPMMGVLGAFIFAAQMINFSIPGTGSSGHLGGGLILAVLLGPHAALIVIASVLTVQAFFFADGGLMALGCNIFNLGFFPAFVAYPLVYRPIARGAHGNTRAWVAAIAAAVVALQLGAFSVVLETKASGISELPFGTFALVVLPIHLAIGLVEGIATAAVVSFVAQARPEALLTVSDDRMPFRLRPLVMGIALAALILGSAASWLASTRPDGLEWAIAKVAGSEEIEGASSRAAQRLAGIQQKTAVLPDYGFRTRESVAHPTGQPGAQTESWPAVNAGTSASGVVGGTMTLVLALAAGWILKAAASRRARKHGAT